MPKEKEITFYMEDENIESYIKLLRYVFAGEIIYEKHSIHVRVVVYKTVAGEFTAFFWIKTGIIDKVTAKSDVWEKFSDIVSKNPNMFD